MTNDDLPEGWLSCSLGDVVDYGKTTKAEPSEIEESAWILELEDIEKDTSKLLERRTFADRQSKSTKNRFEVGDVLYGKLRPYLNKVIIADQPGYCTTEIIPLKPNTALEGRFLFSWLKHPVFIDYVSNVSHGLSMPRLGTDAGKAAPFILAPVAEQKRIADKLEAVLGRVDACRARLDRVPDLLKRIRQSVLTAATSGQLTEDWREEHKVSQEWVETPLGKLIADGPKNGLYKASTSYGQGIRILRIDNFYAGFIGAWSGLKRLTVGAAELEDFGLKVGDIVVNRVNSMSHLGKSALVRELPEPCVFESNMMRIRLDVSRLLPEFAILVLTSPRGIVQLQQNAKQAVNQASINQGDVQAVVVAVPSIPEQAEIIRRVEALFALADRIEARLSAARAQVERLTPAILSKAFRGDLVPQDPSDEPASVLLNRQRKQSVPAKALRKR